jgi:hypothetical protein
MRRREQPEGAGKRGSPSRRVRLGRLRRSCSRFPIGAPSKLCEALFAVCLKKSAVDDHRLGVRCNLDGKASTIFTAHTPVCETFRRTGRSDTHRERRHTNTALPDTFCQYFRLLAWRQCKQSIMCRVCRSPIRRAGRRLRETCSRRCCKSRLIVKYQRVVSIRLMEMFQA